ncbi:MAG: hypothetical protein QXT50_01105 [Thermofilum sp.]
MSVRVPDIATFRCAVESIPDQRDRLRVKTAYLLAARASELCFKDSDVPAYGGLMRHRLEEFMNQPVLLTKLATLKKRRDEASYRVIALPLRFEPWAAEIAKFIDEHGSLKPLFDITRRQLRNVTSKHLGVNPHWLRHARITHLVDYYGFTAEEITTYAGWSYRALGQSMLETYLHLNWRSYVLKLFKPLPRTSTYTHAQTSMDLIYWSSKREVKP